MTDERMGDALWSALRRLPPRSGVVVRHGASTPRQRAERVRRVRRIAMARRLTLVVAGGAGAAGTHGKGRPAPLRTWSAHNRRQAIAGLRAGASALFISPIFATRTHPTAKPIGPMHARRIGAGLPVIMIALGGMTERRWRKIKNWGFGGYAAIDAWLT